MEGVDTGSLRAAAASWSLAGDQKLLTILENLHERIVSKCQAANAGLEGMVAALDTASISLQNVNNRFMALNNSQFVESRVYDDDIDVAAPPVKSDAEPPKPPEPASELAGLREGLLALQAYHEPVNIVDSDSDTDDEDEGDRVVLRPLDLYSERPLPYIIGSHQWRAKWHAGLVREDSGSDSDSSRAGPPPEQYSDSDREEPYWAYRPPSEQRTISREGSMVSETARPADVAADLARRLGGPPRIPSPEPEIPAQVSGPTKVYRPHQPTAAPLFPEEPPPLDTGAPDGQSPWDSEEDLHSADPRDDNVKQYSAVIHTEAHNSESFVAPAQSTPQASHVERQPDTSRKPVGGISLFGNNRGAESIGAAILKRNQRNNSSDEETKNQPVKTNIATNTQVTQETDKDKTPNDILNDLFSKPTKSLKRVEKVEKKEEKPVKKVDLFADDLFDDIDDLFSNIKTPVKEAKVKENKRSLFDDDDDLFANVDVTSNVDSSNKSSNSKSVVKSKGIFDSDEELFSEKIEGNKNSNLTKSTKEVSKDGSLRDNETVVSKDQLWDDDNSVRKDAKNQHLKSVVSRDELEDDDTSISKIIRKNPNTQEKSIAQISKVKSIFDSDSDDDIFSDFKSKFTNKVADSETKSSKIIVKKPDTSSIDDFGNDDSLFLPKNIPTHVKTESVNIVQRNDNTVKNNNNTVKFEDDDDSLFKQIQNPISIVSESGKYETTNLPEEGTINYKKTDEVLTKGSVKSSPKTKSITIVDSDDELFSNKSGGSTVQNKEISNILGNLKSPLRSPSLFGEEDDDADDIFNKSTEIVNSKEIRNAQEITNPKYDRKSDFKNNETEDTFKGKTENIKKPHDNRTDELIQSVSEPTNITSEHNELTNNINSLSLFGEEDDDADDIFNKSTEIVNSKEIRNAEEITNPKYSRRADFKNSETEDIFKGKTENIKKPQDNRTDELIQSVSEPANIKSEHNERTNNMNIQDKLKEEISQDNSEESKYLCENVDTKVVESSDNDTDVMQSSQILSEKDDFEEVSLLQNTVIERNIENNKTENVDFTENDALLSKESVSDEPDIFSDIFSDVPPEFERPKEPKKSKNVNALFDDDSDDETLFFKKNETVIDEKPDVSFSSQEDRLFHIFHDEPPAIDVDFTQKPLKSLNSDIETPSSKTDSDISNNKIDSEHTVINTMLHQGESIRVSGIKDLESENSVSEEIKPVGKLKPMNININVSTLLPGASPKKSKTIEEIDGQKVTTKTSSSVITNNKDLKKSVSFEGDPDSEVLDNKLSKERAKIQVKRRPSSRRARKEAVRKSGIDFGDDSTDNSSSTDLSKKDDILVSNTFDSKTDTKHIHESKQNRLITKDSEDTDVSTSESTAEKQIRKIASNDAEHKTSNEIDSNENSDLTNAFNKRSNVTSKVVYILNDEDIFTDPKDNSRNVTKNKHLNIIDDEDDDDIFNFNKPSSSENRKIETLGNAYKDVILKDKEIDTLDADEDIFKASISKPKINMETKTAEIPNKSEIDHIEAKIDKLFVQSQDSKVKSQDSKVKSQDSKVKSQDSKVKSQDSKIKSEVKKVSSFLDDLSDDESELFGSKKPTKVSNIFVSEPKSDKVKTEVKLPKVEMTLPKVEQKGSLFGDDADDDLFGGKTGKSQEPMPSKSVLKPKEVQKSTEPVFEDPLSALCQEDDL